MSTLSTALSLLVGTTLVLFSQKPASATSTTLNFEGLPDSTIVTNQYQGLSFSNAIILTAGITLNEFEFPPHSGTDVLSDNGAPITISFSPAITAFSGYFTYLEPLTIKAFNASNNQVASAASRFSSNMALSGVPGSSPNELIQVSNASGIRTITIAGDSNGTSFTLDDASFSSATTTIPTLSPTVFVLLAAALGLVAAISLRHRALAITMFLGAATSLVLISDSTMAEAQVKGTMFPSRGSVRFSDLVVERPTADGPFVISIRTSDTAILPSSLNLISRVGGFPRLLTRLNPVSAGYFSALIPSSAPREVQVSVAVRGKVRRVLSPTKVY